MAAVSATVTPALVPNTCVSKSLSSSSARPAAGLPALRKTNVSCSLKEEHESRKVEPAAAGALAASIMAVAHPALALVDDRLSTEGTGLSLGVSNPLIVWILLGVATLIWALFFVYASSLKEDDDSGLAL
ncbi:hypothetical protein GOP47_0022803 [Adiantum capillus-veneris]|uniref:PSII 6.1 kDa protein n=2 Tax=Adiantum capillus-veneris TaxID=13818 RepID=A0A9D4U812_ADICA|nr:hypothetical protein GOP47_0022803 [Adiantum capillus-veneris]